LRKWNEVKREKEVDPLGIRAPVGATVGAGIVPISFPFYRWRDICSIS
jgi:hypothetical protein